MTAVPKDKHKSVPKTGAKVDLTASDILGHEATAVIQTLRPSRYGKREVHHTEGNSDKARDICGDIDVNESKIRATLRVSKYLKEDLRKSE